MLTRFNRMPFDLRNAPQFTNGGADPFRLRARNAKGNDPAELLIYSEIGTGIDAKDVSGFLADNRGKPVLVRINSPGGFVYDGLTIYNALISHDGKTTAVIEGLAASIASIIAMGCDKVKAFESSSMMIHRAMGVSIGNTADMKECSEFLAKIDGQLAQIYSAKTGRSVATMIGYMTGSVDGTLFDAQEAFNLKLVDEIIRRNGNGASNHNPNRPHNLEKRLDEVREQAHRDQMRAKANRRIKELAGV